MKGMIREVTPDIVGGLIVAIFLGAIGLLGDFLGLKNSANEMFLRYAISGCLFGILIAAAFFVMMSKRSNSIDPTLKQYRFRKRHRILAVAASLLGTGIVTWFLWPVTLPPITLAIENATQEDLVISKVAKFSIDRYTPLEPDHRLATGEALLVPPGRPLKDGQEFRLPAGAKLEASARLLRQSRYRRFVGEDDAYITLVLSDKDDSPRWFSLNRIQFSPGALRSIPLRVRIRYP